jgi:hypothetical protein
MTDWAARYGWGADWLRRNGKEVSEAGARVAELVDWAWDGIYHLDAVKRTAWNGSRVQITIYAPNYTSDLTTFDGSLLTKLVIGAHDHAIRFGISAAGPKYLRLDFWPRDRAKHMYDSHPKIEDRLPMMRSGFIFEDAATAELEPVS